MEFYNAKPITIDWERGLGKAFMITVKDLNSKWLLVGVDEYFLLEDFSFGKFNFDRFLIIPKKPEIIERDGKRIFIKPLYISYSGLTGTINVFIPTEVEIQEIPFYRSDLKENLVYRIFRSVPQYAVFYDRNNRRIFLLSPKEKGKFTYVNVFKEIKESSLFVFEHYYMSPIYFRFIPEGEKIYAIKLWESNSEKKFWRVQMNYRYFNLYCSNEEIINMIKEEKLQRLI